jgi:23S rRNA (guanine745-N1)-methyltransferase
MLCTVRTCHEPLAREDARVVCPRGHSFDIARSGYINLLQPQDRRAATPGDSAEAVEARRRFLDRGFAQPLLSEIRQLVRGDAVLDAGCGEGYYLANCHAAQCSGIDISAAAIDLAARRYKDCEWVVANADRFVPYADGSFDTVMSITGRMNPAEFGRVLKPGGRLIIAVAAPDDLIELRGKPNRDRVERTIDTFAHFSLIEHRQVTTRADLDRESMLDILTATYRPYDQLKPVRGPVTLSLDVLVFTAASRP